ncbi:methyltransferase domain-containing protein [Acidiferrimicrobium sp. IK]|uniref:methyltransferase domain-containing protein n=1 Tax=Acidiferrimicrobium sp. IK TaxID=2871700 RepID=UPI0039673BDE
MQPPSVNFDALVAEGLDVPVEGWDFSWFHGRATEQRPSWGYARLLSGRLQQACSALDIQTGGGEVFAWALEQTSQRPFRLAATESWPPNATLATRRLGHLRVGVVRAADDGALPFGDGAFDLVSSRHPVEVVWPEVARVLQRGGTFFSQMVGPGSNRELYEFLMGPQRSDPSRSSQVASADAAAAGLQLVQIQEQALEVVFFDIAAVVHFLRKVPWTVPDFTVERYYDRLAALHGQLHRDGRFVCHSQRYLIELRRQ